VVISLKVIEFVAVFLLTLVAGVFWGTWLSLTRSKAAFSPEVFLAIGKRMVKNLAFPMRLLTPATLLSLVVLCVGLYWARQTTGLLLAIAAVVCLLTTMAITLVVNVPIDYQVKSWTIATMPADWQGIWNRWTAFHALRTLLSLGALVSTLAALLIA
jgi:uncharacterized membrane protein